MRLKFGAFATCLRTRFCKLAKMSFDHLFQVPRPAPPPDPEWGALQIAPPAVSVAKMRAICVLFGSACAVDRARIFKLLCVMYPRPFQACVEAGEMSLTRPPGGEGVRLHEARAHALRQLFVRVHMLPGDSTRCRRPGKWWRDPQFMAPVISAGIRVALKMMVAGSRSEPAPSVPRVGPRVFDVLLGNAAGLPAFGVATN